MMESRPHAQRKTNACKQIKPNRLRGVFRIAPPRAISANLTTPRTIIKQ